MPKRPARCWTREKSQPYTRREYIHGTPPVQVRKWVHGREKNDYDLTLLLLVEEEGNIRDCALEACRVAAARALEAELQGDYYMRVRVYPHQVLREHKFMAVAGADRLQDGMRLAFGKPVHLAARVRPGQAILEVRTYRRHEERVKRILKVAASKLPLPTRIRRV